MGTSPSRASSRLSIDQFVPSLKKKAEIAKFAKESLKVHEGTYDRSPLKRTSWS
jgi:hypothetical protein